MDPISALIAAVVAGAIEAAKPTATSIVKDAYAGLKALITRKFGKAAAPMQAVEERPDSTLRQAALKEQMVEVQADTDSELMKAVTDLVAVLRTHAPHSVTNINTGGGASFAGSVNTGGGALVAGGVNTGGGAFVGRDQRITNVTVHGIDEVDKLVAVLREGFGDLVRNPDAPSLERVSAVLDEISKLYQLMDSEMTRYLSLTLDNLGHDRKELLDLDGGKVTVRASEARGHCSRIDALYRGTLRPWFVDRLSRDQMTTLDQSFSALGHSDIDMSYAIEKLANWLSEKASATLTLIDKGDTEGARREIKGARIDASDLRRKLTATVSQMRGIQADLIMAAG